MLWFNLLLFLVSALVLVASGSYLVKSLSKISKFLRFPEFVIGFILMAFATSIPELFVGITAGLAKNSALALGNVIGSNIADLTLVAGIAVVLVKGFKIKTKETRIDSFYMFFIALLPMVLMFIGRTLSRIDGIILLVIFFLYSTRLILKRKRYPKELMERVGRKEIVLNVFIFIFSLVFLFLSAKYLIEYAGLLSIDLTLPPILIGLFLIAVGTSLPELIFETRAVLAGHTEMALGDLIGSVVVNSTLVLGVTSLIYPITANFLFFVSSGAFMILVTFLFATFVESGRRLYWKEGIAMIMLYVFFILLEFYIKGL